MSRDPAHLHPDIQPKHALFHQRCAAAGLEVMTTCTYRSNKEQQDCWDQGRTKPGPLCGCGGKSNPIGTCKVHPLGLCVTWAKPGESKHNFEVAGTPASKAFDFVVLRHGKIIWGTSGNGIDEDPSDDLTDDLELWQRAGVIAEGCGLSWAGRWPKPKREFPHCEIP